MTRWRILRYVVGGVTVVLVFAHPGAAGSAAAGGPFGAKSVSGRYQPPVLPLIVLHPFDPPAHRYGAGTVGVDLTAGSGAVVVAAGAGTVVFAGSVAGRGLVVIAHPDGIRTEYEPLRPSVVVGQIVVGGTRIGVISGHHVGCTEACLHWGARRGNAYIDPLGLLHPLGPVRLLPLSGQSFPVVRPPAGQNAPRVEQELGGHALGWACSKVARRRSTETWV